MSKVKCVKAKKCGNKMCEHWRPHKVKTAHNSRTNKNEPCSIWEECSPLSMGDSVKVRCVEVKWSS